MNKQQQTLAGCALFSFSITLIIYEIIVRYVSSYGIPYFPAFAITFLASGAIYTLLFRLLMIAYSKFLFGILSPIQSIGGTWFHLTKIMEPETEIRYGQVSIGNELGALSVSGDNYNEKNEYRSSFHSLATYLDESQLLILYRSEGAHRPASNRIRNGMIDLTIVERKGRLRRPQMLKGSWKDTVPSKYSGSIILFSNEKEWEEEKQKEFERLRQEKK